MPALSITKTEAVVIFTAFFIAYTLFSPLIGVISDRYDVRLLISVFVALLGMGTLLMSYSSSVVTTSVFFTLAGIGSTACWTPVMAVAQRWVSDKRRGVTLASNRRRKFSGHRGGRYSGAHDYSFQWSESRMDEPGFVCIIGRSGRFLLNQE